MDSIHELKEALSARSETRSLDELQSRGRKNVKVIRAEQIAGMIAEAVERAIRDSGLISKDEADHLVERSRAEFKSVVAERRQEAQELEDARRQLDEAKAQVLKLRRALDSAGGGGLEVDFGTDGASGGGGGGEVSAELMMRMMNEVATMKAQMAQGGVASGPGGAQGLTDALEKLTSSMNEKMEKFGKKMGVSSAVDASQISFDNLFKDMDDAKIESNIDDMVVKQKTGSGIAANLARLKKLKGGG